MPRKKFKISTKCNGIIIPAIIGKECHDGFLLKGLHETSHVTFIDDQKGGLHTHVTDDKTGKHSPYPFFETLAKGAKEMYNSEIIYSDIEEFRREYQDSSIMIFKEKDWELPIIKDPNDSNHMIIDFDKWFENIQHIIMSLGETKILLFDFDNVIIGETFLIFSGLKEDKTVYLLSRIDEMEWDLLEISKLFTSNSENSQ